MTKVQQKLRELRERQSRERGRIAELAVADTLTDEMRGEMDAIETGVPDLERQIRAATSAVEIEETEQRDAAATGSRDGLDAEDRERLELRSKVKFGGYVAAAIEQRSADGAEAEYNASIGITGNRFPLELLAPHEQRGARTEDRASTGIDTMTTPRTWLDRLFSGTAAEAVGVSMESVPVGKSSPPRDRDGCDGGAARQERSRCRCRLDALSVVEMTPKAERRAAAVQHRGHRPYPRLGVGADARATHGAD